MMPSRDPVDCVAKVLTANDLGLTGSHQSGICIPRIDELLRFFPDLDAGLHNPESEVAVSTPSTGEHHLLRYVYYNGRLLGINSRNEYRLTRTAGLYRALDDPQPGDSIRFCKFPDGVIEVDLVRDTPSGPLGPTGGAADGTEIVYGWTIVRVTGGNNE